MRLSRELGTIVRPMVAQVQLRDPARYLQEAVSTLTEAGRLQGALRVPAAVAPIKITADLRAGLIHCAVTVPAPREGRPTTRVNWLVRQLKTAPAHLCIEASTAWQRGRGPARTISQARSDPKTLLDETGHELRSFTLSLSSNAGPARGQGGHGSFVNSVLAAAENFYTDVVQHIKPWNPAPPKLREGEPPLTDEPVPGEAACQGPDDMHPATDSVTPAEISGPELPKEYASSL
jgi:hypothetical protein